MREHAGRIGARAAHRDHEGVRTCVLSPSATTRLARLGRWRLPDGVGDDDLVVLAQIRRRGQCRLVGRLSGWCARVTVMSARLVGGRYQLHTMLGRGGMAAVWRGVDTRLDGPVAVKILDAAARADPTMLQRLDREARTVARLAHPRPNGTPTTHSGGYGPV